MDTLFLVLKLFCIMKIEDFLKDKKIEIKDIKYKITKSKEKEDGVIIYLDNKEKISVSVDNYFKYGISSLQGLDQNLYDILKKEEKIFLGYLSALRKLSIKDFTVKQIEDFLKVKKQLEENEINHIIKKLTDFGLLDDEKYCINRVNYLNKQLLSIKQIKVKLNKEGVSKDLIEKYVINNSEDEYFKAKKMAERYSNSIKNKSLNAKKQAILNKLVSAGYSYDAGKSAIESLDIIVSNENDLLKKEYNKAKTKYIKKYEDYDLRRHIYVYLISKGFKSEDINTVMED